MKLINNKGKRLIEIAPMCPNVGKPCYEDKCPLCGKKHI